MYGPSWGKSADNGSGSRSDKTIVIAVFMHAVNLVDKAGHGWTEGIVVIFWP